MRMRTLVALAVGAALIIVGCGTDEEPMDGWGPGVPAAVVVIVAPSPAPATTVASDIAGSWNGDGESAPLSPTPTQPPSPEYAPNGQTVRVRSLDNSFRNEVTEVVVGTEIWWTNDGRNEHDVLPVDSLQEWGAERDVFQPGDEYRHSFLEPGTYSYYCSIHGNEVAGMVGTVIVTAPS